MNVINIALNKFKRTLQNKVSFILLIAMPVFMIFIMGYALKPAFQTNTTIKKIPPSVNFTNTELVISKSYSEYLPQSNNAEEMQKLANQQKSYGNTFTILKLDLQSPLKKLSSFQYFAASMLLFFLLNSGIGIGNNIINERSDKIYMRINSFPVKKSEYLLGQVLGGMLTSILQAIAVILFSTLLFGVNWGNNFIGIAVTLLLMILISSSLGVLFSSIVNSEKALSTGLCIVLWFISFMSGGFSPVPALEPVGKLTFYRWGFDSLAIFMTGGTFKAAASELTFLAIFIVILWTAALAFFNWRSSNE